MKTLMSFISCVCLLVELVLADQFLEDMKSKGPITSRRKRSTRSCDQKFSTITTGHTACVAASSQFVNGGVTTAEKTTIVNSHNNFRASVSPTAQDMIKMSWDDEVALLAQIWAENCQFAHDDNYKRYIPGRLQLGQNLFSSSNQRTWDTVVTAWHDEVTDFNYDGTPTGEVGHYTQVVWAKSVKVGCGYANCGSGGHIYACNYGPSGNSAGSTNRPYSSGTSCGQCQGRCTNNLCDCGDLVCLNGGTMNLNTCTCSCKNRPHYVGNNCALNCSLLSDTNLSLCGSGVYSKSNCALFSNVPFDCASTCDVCPYGGIDFSQTSTTSTTSPVTGTGTSTTSPVTGTGTSTTSPVTGSTTTEGDKSPSGTSMLLPSKMISIILLVIWAFYNH